MNAGDSRHPRRYQLRMRGVGSVDRVVLRVAQVAAIVRQTVRRPRAFVADDRPHNTAAIRARALPHELQVAVEAFETGGAQCRWHLALQAGLGMIARSAHGLGYGERNRLITGITFALAAKSR